VGATTAADYLEELGRAGIGDLSILSRTDYFARSASAETRKVAEGFGARAIVLRGRAAGPF
jgi:hypothetical protein